MKTFFPIVFILISIVVFFTFVSPLYKDTVSLKSDVVAYDQALASSKNLETTQANLMDKYQKVTKIDIERLEKFLPNTVDNIGLILEIQKIASSHGMPLKNIHFDAPKLDDQKSSNQIVIAGNKSNSLYGIFKLDFATTGDYDTFVSFLNDLEHNLRLVNVKSVSFAVPVASKTSTPDSYNYNVSIETYWLKN